MRTENNPRKICENGWLFNVDKPIGKSSFAVCSYLRKLSRIKKVGHAGTLDPNATGVLLVAIGKATKRIDSFVGLEKEYRGRIRFGLTTDTYDTDGTVLYEKPVEGLTREMVEEGLKAFSGEISQVPPSFSALKHKGRPLYKYARKGEIITPEPRKVTIYEIALEMFEPPETVIRVTCSRGTYIRSIAHDLGEALGFGAVLSGLTRTRIGDFGLDDSLKWDELAGAVEGMIL